MILRRRGIDLLFYTDIQDYPLTLEESSKILSVNAREKAIQAAKQTGYMSLGDDSAICVRALDYFPGVYSRRWAFDEKDDVARNELLLKLMENESDRRVYLISRFSLVDTNGKEIAKTHVKNKFILSSKIIGDKGFGYDPILIPDSKLIEEAREYGRIGSYETVPITVGLMSQKMKNAINNRGRIAWEIKYRLSQTPLSDSLLGVISNDSAN